MLKHFWLPFPMSSTEFPLDYLLPLLKRPLNCWLFVFHDIYLLFMLCASRSKDKNCQPWFLRSRRRHSVKKTVWSYCRQTAPSILATLAGRSYMISLSFKVVAHSCRSLSSFEQNSRKYTSFVFFLFFLFCLTMSTLSWLLLFDLCKKIVNGKILGGDFVHCISQLIEYLIQLKKQVVFN